MHVLCLDSGSSSLKHALYDMPAERLDGSGTVEARADDQLGALGDVVKSAQASGTKIGAVGHRLVFGGPDRAAPLAIDDALVAEFAGYEPLDPLHLPAQLALVRGARSLLPTIPHVACFDTAFFVNMPAVAQRYPLPASVGPLVRRYGYHGLSYEYILSTGQAKGRTIVAHLGSGASMAAIRDGSPLDTTMGFSPIGGLMMGTRSGDLDPGVLLYLLRRGSSADEVEELSRLLNERSGLLGVSGTTPDMRALLERSAGDADARTAIELFIYIAVKQAAGLAAVLGGLDTLIFTGGIGEHGSSVRAGIGAGLAHLGVEIDAERNAGGDSRISSSGSDVDVLVIPTNENLVIARHTYARALLAG